MRLGFFHRVHLQPSPEGVRGVHRLIYLDMLHQFHGSMSFPTWPMKPIILFAFKYVILRYQKYALFIWKSINHMDEFLNIFDPSRHLWTNVDYWLTPWNHDVVIRKSYSTPPMHTTSSIFNMCNTLGQISLLRAVSVCTKTTLISGSVGGQGSGRSHTCTLGTFLLCHLALSMPTYCNYNFYCNKIG